MKNAKKLLSYSYFGFFTALLLSAPPLPIWIPAP